MLVVYTNQVTNRLKYTLDFICSSRGVEYKITSDTDLYQNEQGVKLNYSFLDVEGLKIEPSGMLFEEEIKLYKLSNGTFGSAHCFLFEGRLDPIASIFYVLVRYEEYLETERDKYGRFKFSNSCLNYKDIIQQAVCDRLVVELFNSLDLTLEPEPEKPKLFPTFDIDNTYAYRYKVGNRKLLSIFRDLLKFDFDRIKERRKVELGGKDPYDTYDKIKEIAERFPDTQLFWLVGELSEKDRNISLDAPMHQNLIQYMDTKASVNLHPSFASNSAALVIKREKERLEDVIGHPITKSRQHFLRFTLPKTYQALLAAGFKEEFSMGFAERTGFRCGTARAHYWFDLSVNKVTDLIIHPFVYMDGTLHEYMNLTIDESKIVISNLYNEIKMYGGDFSFLWHNETIGDYRKWKGWSEVLNYTLTLNDE